MNYQQRQENIFSNEQNTENDDVENGDKENADRNESEIVDGSVIDNDELEHFIQNYSIVQYSIRIGDLFFCNFKGWVFIRTHPETIKFCLIKII